MTVRLHWTPEALARLRAIQAYIAQESPEAARRTVTRLIKRAGQIAEFPHSGRLVPEYDSTDLRELLERPYRILYRIKTQQIDIVTIWHYRRLLPEKLP